MQWVDWNHDLAVPAWAGVPLQLMGYYPIGWSTAFFPNFGGVFRGPHLIDADVPALNGPGHMQIDTDPFTAGFKDGQ